MRRKRVEGQITETEIWLREIKKRIGLLMSENSKTISASTFSEHPR